MIIAFKSVLVLSIAVLHMPPLSVCKSVSGTTKKEPSTRRSNGYVETCFDVEPKRCANFDFYCGTRPQYMSKNCKLTCKMCKPGDPLTDLSSKCAVELDKSQETLCVLNEWISICPHSCREYICADKAQDCAALASSGSCLSQNKYMTENCMLACAMCSPGDPVMDTTSECKPKQAQCNDWEWKRICPHTCKNYLPIQPQGSTYQPGVTTNQQVSTPVVQPQPRPGSVVQPGQPQQPVGQVPSQQTLQPQPAPTQTQLQQTAQLQPQVQQPGQPPVNSALQPAPVQPQMQQTTAQVGSVMQPSQVQTQIPIAASQVNPAMQTAQVQPQVQQPAPQVNPAMQTAQVQPQIQQTTPLVNPAVQTTQVQPQMQQPAPQVNPAVQTTQIQPQMQQPMTQPQPLPVQQRVQQPYALPQTSQPSYQPQVNTGQTYQPIIQQPQPGTVRGPIKKKKKGLKKEKSAKATPTEEKKEKSAKATPTEEKTSSKTEKTDKKEESKKDDSHRKLKTRASKAKDKNDKRTGKKEDKKARTKLKENKESATMPKLKI